MLYFDRKIEDGRKLHDIASDFIDGLTIMMTHHTIAIFITHFTRTINWLNALIIVVVVVVYKNFQTGHSKYNELQFGPTISAI